MTSETISRETLIENIALVEELVDILFRLSKIVYRQDIALQIFERVYEQVYDFRAALEMELNILEKQMLKNW